MLPFLYSRLYCRRTLDMFLGPPCKSLTANWTKGVVILEFRDIKRRGEEPVSKKKKRGSNDRVESIEGVRNVINGAGGSARIALAREHGRVIEFIPNLLIK
jgi:hypothetical protein